MNISLADIEMAVCRRFKMEPLVLRGQCRKRKIARPRQITMFLARELTALSLPQIGRALGDRDHTTVLHGVRRIKALMPDKPKLAAHVDELRQAIPHITHERLLSGAVCFRSAAT